MYICTSYSKYVDTYTFYSSTLWKILHKMFGKGKSGFGEDGHLMIKYTY